MTAAAQPPSETPKLEPIEVLVERDLSGWAESLYNVTTGSNYLRTREYYDLIRTLDSYASELAAAQATIARQAEELERVRKDSERYRWLRNDALMKLQSGPICVAADKWGNPLTQHPEDDPGLGPALHITLDGKELDAAIDSAIAKERS